MILNLIVSELKIGLKVQETHMIKDIIDLKNKESLQIIG